jgi:hypothetical protein
MPLLPAQCAAHALLSSQLTCPPPPQSFTCSKYLRSQCGIGSGSSPGPSPGPITGPSTGTGSQDQCLSGLTSAFTNGGACSASVDSCCSALASLGSE